MTGEAAVQALCDLVVALTGVTAGELFLAYGQQGRPSFPHILMTEITDARKTWPRGDEQDRTLRFQVDGFGDDMKAKVKRLAMLLVSSDSRVSAAVVSITAVTDVSNTTTLYQSGYEPRATLEVEAEYTRTETGIAPHDEAEQIDLTVTDTETGTTATFSVQ